MSDDTWIRANIHQRECTLFCQFNEQHPTSCMCFRSRSSHSEHETRRTHIWTRSKNTRSVPCRNFGTIQFEQEKTAKFVRLDVDTQMGVVKTLLLEVWNIPSPKWIISVMGDKHTRHPTQGSDTSTNIEEDLPKEKELGKHVRMVMKTFSNGQNMWVTTEGINFGLSKVIGQALSDNQSQPPLANTSLVGIFGWGGCQRDTIDHLVNNRSLAENEDENRPSALYPHHILTDDGTENPVFAHKSFQEFRTKLEMSLTNHAEGSPSLPLVMLLYGGWTYVIDGIVEAVENCIPVVILKGTGGFADILANVFESSKEDRTNTTTSESGQKWTGTVIDDRLRKEVEAQFLRVHGNHYKAGQHKILQCIQRRELLTPVELDEDETTLAKAIITAILKAKTMPEILHIIDYYMPSRMFEGEGTAAVAMHVMRPDQRGLCAMASLFLFQAMMLDLPEYVQFIIDYEGVNLSAFVEENAATFSNVTDVQKQETNEYKQLLMWAIRSGRHKCASLFWKKGNDLLASALEMTSILGSSRETEENIGKQKTLRGNEILFQRRAQGLIDECYHDDKEETMRLIQYQATGKIWTQNLWDRCFEEGNRKIFASEGFRKYIDRVWYGKINPPNMDSYKRGKMLPTVEKEPISQVFKRITIAPVTTFSLNLIFYIAFLTLFGHTLLFELGPEYTVLEGILVCWWITFVVEEGRQFWNIKVTEEEHKNKCFKVCTKLGLKLKGYFLGNYWNILDITCLLFFLIGGVLMAIYHSDNRLDGVYQAARMFLSLDIMFFTWRLLQHLAISSVMGPVLEMIYQMIKDLFPFLVIMFVFIISQGLAAHALLYPNRDWTWEALLDIPKSAFWNIFGELGLEEIEADEPQDCSSNPLLFENDTKSECPSTLGKYAVPFLLAMYMLLMNVLLLNILIARFSFTFQTVHEQIEWLAAWQQARVTLEYFKKPPLPPPLNIFFHLAQILVMCVGRRNGVACSQAGYQRDDKMAAWERAMAESYLASAECKSGSERLSIRDKREANQVSPSVSTVNIPQEESNAKLSSTPITPNNSVTEDGRSAGISEMVTKRLKKVESTQKEMRKMLEEVLNVTRNLAAAASHPPRVEAMALDDVEDGEETA